MKVVTLTISVVVEPTDDPQALVDHVTGSVCGFFTEGDHEVCPRLWSSSWAMVEDVPDGELEAVSSH